MERLHDPLTHHMASDNYAGIHPVVLDAIISANIGHQRAYGDDTYCALLKQRVVEIFGERSQVVTTFNGTGTNVVALQSMTQRWEAVACARTAHINTDETGAPEHVGGMKLLPIDAENGRMTVEAFDKVATGWGDQHSAQPKVLSITQSTELGTVYPMETLRALITRAHDVGMTVHMDGTRLANAAVSLGVDLSDLTSKVGVDVLSLGGSKLGALAAEALVVLNPDAVRGLSYLRKSSLQLPSKSRFIAAQMLALYGMPGQDPKTAAEPMWRTIATNSNAMAKLLAQKAADAGVEIMYPVESNAVFARLPQSVAQELKSFSFFYDWDSSENIVRWMTSFDTNEDHINAFAEKLQSLM